MRSVIAGYATRAEKMDPESEHLEAVNRISFFLLLVNFKVESNVSIRVTTFASNYWAESQTNSVSVKQF